VVIGTDCIGSCKSHYHTRTATTAPHNVVTTEIYKTLNIKTKLLNLMWTLNTIQMQNQH